MQKEPKQHAQVKLVLTRACSVFRGLVVTMEDVEVSVFLIRRAQPEELSPLLHVVGCVDASGCDCSSVAFSCQKKAVRSAPW